MDAFLLSRLQFALNISFHILFPTITMAMGWFLFYFKLRSNTSGHPVWMRMYRFWVRVFALSFALGVVSGVTMSFQFGTNCAPASSLPHADSADHHTPGTPGTETGEQTAAAPVTAAAG